jgi:hypothetical protein
MKKITSRRNSFAVLRIRIRDPVIFLPPWIRDPDSGSGMGKNPDPGSGYEHPGPYFLELRKNFLG